MAGRHGLRIRREAGPANPIAAVPLRGLGRDEPFAVRIGGRMRGVHRAPIVAPHLPAGTRVEQGAELSYAVLAEHLPSLEDIRDSFAATGVALDLLFDDGTRLSDHAAAGGGPDAPRVLDQYGAPVDAEGRRTWKLLLVDQWHLTRIDIGSLAGRTVQAVEIVVSVPPGHGGDLAEAELVSWVDEIRLAVPAPSRAQRPSDRVRTTRGTHSSHLYSRGNTTPAVGLPHAFITGTPVTRADEAHWLYLWQEHNDERNRPVIQAFATSSIPSPWIGERGAFQLMPWTEAGTPDPDRTRRQLPFRHEDELDRAHLYSVLFENGLRAEMAPAEHGLILRFRFPSDQAAIILDQQNGQGALTLEVVEGRARISGWSDARAERIPIAPRAYLAAEIDAPVIDAGMLDTPDRPGVCGFVRLDAGEDRTVTLRLSVSYLGVAQAQATLDRELPEGTRLEDVAAAAADRWDALLGAVEFDGASDDRLTALSSNLYRLFLFPGDVSELDVSGASGPRRVHASPFLPPEREHTAESTGCAIVPGPLSVNNGFWDTYRTAWPALLLLDPRAGELLDGFVQHFREGGWMSRWTAPGYVDVMVGTSSDAIVADAARKGVAGFDVVEAYDSALRNALTVSTDPHTGRKGLERSAFLGYTDTGVPEGLSWTMEGAVNDDALASFAAHLATDPADPRREEHRANAVYLRRRAAAYALLFDHETGFFRGRDAEGSFAGRAADYDPRVWGHDYTETNGWGMAFTAPHDGAGLAALLGGREMLEAKLDRFFSEAEQETGREEYRGPYSYQIHEISEAKDIRLGMYAPSNQPAHHIAAMYLYAGAPHKAQRILRESIDRLFTGSDLGQGYPGDEDNGEMSAWWLFQVLGLYPLRPGHPAWVLSAPLVPEARVRLAGGAVLRITASPCGPEDRYVQSVAIDGEPWPSTELPHERIARGAHLDFALGPEPSGWGMRPEDAPTSLTEPGAHPLPLSDLAAPQRRRRVLRGEAAFDDDATTLVTLAAGDWVGVELAEPAVVSLMTITAPAAGTLAWALESSEDGEDWTLVEERTEPFRWPSMTRPFLVTATGARVFWRVRMLAAASLAEVELFDGPVEPRA